MRGAALLLLVTLGACAGGEPARQVRDGGSVAYDGDVSPHDGGERIRDAGPEDAGSSDAGPRCGPGIPVAAIAPTEVLFFDELAPVRTATLSNIGSGALVLETLRKRCRGAVHRRPPPSSKS